MSRIDKKELCRLKEIELRLEGVLKETEKKLEEEEKALPGGTSAGQEWGQQFRIDQNEKQIALFKKMLGKE